MSAVEEKLDHLAELVAGKIEGLESRLGVRLDQIQKATTDTAEGVVSLVTRMARLEARVEKAEARLTLLEREDPPPSPPSQEEGLTHAAQ